jgi:uroporphyrinogen decarboxylase
MGDKMTINERWKAICNGDPVDRVPTFPACIGHAAIINGQPSVGAIYEKPGVSYKLQKLAREMYQYDQPIILIPSGYYSAEWGTKILYPYNPKMGSVAFIDPVVKKVEDVEKLEIPDPKTLPFYKEFIGVCKNAIANKDPLLLYILASNVTAVCPFITHVENFMRWLIYEPSVAKKLLAKSKEYGLRVAEYYVNELGADNFIAANGFPTDSNVLISPKQFGDFVLPSIREFDQKVLNLGVPQFFHHWCSNHNANIKAGHIDNVPIGKPGIIQFGPEVDLKVAVERFGKKNIVMGNVDPPAMMIQEHDECLRLAKVDIEKGKHSPKGYILGVGCELPPRAPPANVYALVEASREYGRY